MSGRTDLSRIESQPRGTVELVMPLLTSTFLSVREMITASVPTMPPLARKSVGKLQCVFDSLDLVDEPSPLRLAMHKVIIYGTSNALWAQVQEQNLVAVYGMDTPVTVTGN